VQGDLGGLTGVLSASGTLSEYASLLLQVGTTCSTVETALLVLGALTGVPTGVLLALPVVQHVDAFPQGVTETVSLSLELVITCSTTDSMARHQHISARFGGVVAAGTSNHHEQ
jgi:hypothetical protein